MNKLSNLILVALFFCAAPALAQPYGYLTPSTRTKESAAAPSAHIPQQLELETTTETLDAFIPEGLEGRVQQGVLPQLFSRNYGQQRTAAGARKSGRRRPGRQQTSQRPVGRQGNTGSQTGSLSGSASEVRAFVDNAFKFDTNGDGRLAAHELSSLFLVLTSTLNAENTSPASSTSNSPLTADEDLIRRQRVRDAETVFLQLALSFDSNTDGALSSGEVSSLASCVQQNNFSLTDAALQNETQRNQLPATQPRSAQPAPAPAPAAPAPAAPNQS